MQNTSDPEDFKPRGTIAFVILLLLLTGAVWYSIYALQLERHIK
ncbi:MAG: hypothetical protein P4L51_00115 [Puia sp.]|nr:hypothetical protein [Puia sp.]